MDDLSEICGYFDREEFARTLQTIGALDVEDLPANAGCSNRIRSVPQLPEPVRGGAT